MPNDEIIHLLGHKRVGGTLILDENSSTELIKEFGSPLLVFSPRRLIENYETVFKAFKRHFNNNIIAYAFKANYLPSVCSVLSNMGSGAEVMTGLELYLAQQSGFDPAKMVFNGPAKCTEELTQAIRIGIGLINTESLEELKELAETQWPAPINLVGIRIAPKMSKEIRKNALIRPESKLGLDVERAIKAAKKYGVNTKLPFGAISVHVGCRHPPGIEVFENSMKKLAAFGRHLETKFGIDLSTVDVGGGFPPRYLLEQTKVDIDTFAAVAHEQLSVLRSSPTIVIEPGRYLIGDAMLCLASVVRKKKSSGQSWGLLDVGVNVLIPLGFSNYDIVPCKSRIPKKERLSIGGPLCQPNDEFIRDTKLNLVQGDVVAILNAGAYTLSMAGQFGYPQPGIVKIENGKPKLVYARRSYERVLSSLKD